MKNLIKTSFLTFFLILSSCKKKIKNNNSIEDNDNPKEVISSDKNQIELRLSCGEEGLSNYIEDGWIIVEEYTEDKVCTWKSFPASKNCDMEKDKGCKITKPDKIGEEKIYLLQK